MKTTHLIFWIVLILGVLFLINYSLNAVLTHQPEEGCPDIIEGNPNASLTIKYIYSPSCYYCQEEEPVLESLLAKYGDKFKIEYYNMQRCLDVTKYYGVKGTPYFVFNIEGDPEEIEHPGFLEQDVLEEVICEVDGC